jgi:hypothetical protein
MEETTITELLDFFDITDTKLKSETPISAIQSLHHTANIMIQNALKDPDLPITERDSVVNLIIEYFNRITNQYNLTVPSFLIDQLNNNRSTTEPIIEKKPDIAVNSFHNEYTAGTINPLKKKTITRHVNINTKFRHNYSLTQSTDFTLQLGSPIKNIVSMRLASVELWNAYYNISKYYGNDEVKIRIYDISNDEIYNDDTYRVQLQRGYYTLTGLAEYFNNAVFAEDSSFNRIKTQYDPVLGKFIFRLNEDITPPPDITYAFELDFDVNGVCKDSCDVMAYRERSLGWILGYRKANYKWADYNTVVSHDRETIGYIPESVAYLDTNYLMVNVDDYNKNYAEIVVNPFYGDTYTANATLGNSSKATSMNIIGKIPMNARRYELIARNQTNSNFIKREYFGPVNIDRLRIQLLDEYGRVIDINNMDYSITLEIEQLYDL